MPFQRKSLRALVDQAQTEMNARLPEGDARLPSSVLNVLAHVYSGGVSGLYGYLDWLALQLMIDTAESEYLERWANIWGINRKPASAAVGQVSVPGVAGAVVPVGLLLQRGDGRQFSVSSETPVSPDSVATVDVVALDPGVLGDTDAGETLQLVEAVAGLESSATVTDTGIAGGADTETDDALRERLLFRIQQPPHGGAMHDYVAWAKEVPGVTRAWCYPLELGLGTVTVRFVCNGSDDIFPDELKIDEVAAHIESVRPLTAQVSVVSPIPVPINFTIQAVTPGSQAVKDAVVVELQDLLLRESVPGGTILVSHIRAAISAAAGESDHILVSPIENIENGVGEMSTMGSVTWE
jgi:uncharacterized phage protein gp47/JayE